MKKTFTVLFSLTMFLVGHGQTNELEQDKHLPRDTVYIKLGQKLLFIANVNESKTLLFSEVAVATDIEKTVSMELTYTEGVGSMLKIHNPFKEQIVYTAALYAYTKKAFIETSTIPIYPGISAFETWPYKIDLIQLSGFKLVAGK